MCKIKSAPKWFVFREEERFLTSTSGTYKLELQKITIYELINIFVSHFP